MVVMEGIASAICAVHSQSSFLLPLASHFRSFHRRLQVEPAGRQRRGALSMNGSLFAELDRVCGQVALALHNVELQVYAVLTLVLVLGILLFPPRNDPDQV
jgi:hypothetical protein